MSLLKSSGHGWPKIQPRQIQAGKGCYQTCKPLCFKFENILLPLDSLQAISFSKKTQILCKAQFISVLTVLYAQNNVSKVESSLLFGEGMVTWYLHDRSKVEKQIITKSPLNWQPHFLFLGGMLPIKRAISQAPGLCCSLSVPLKVLG